MPDSAKALWVPTDASIAMSHMHRFAQAASAVGEIHSWSISQPGAFWSMVWDECGVVGTKGKRAFVAAQDGVPMSTAQFFPDASLSVVENMLATCRRKMKDGWPSMAEP